MPAKQNVEVEGRTIALTNLEKELYPGSHFTKGQVIDYYIRVARWLIPHFYNRPVTLNRFPDGVHGKTFYEKNAPRFTPEWIQTAAVPRAAGGVPIRYICINDLPTLVWCANVASLELHPFLHRADALHMPTSIVFDLDPGEGVSLVQCAEVGFFLKGLMERMSLECWPKVSGSKGLQVYIPLNTATTYSLTRSFAQNVAQLLERKHPKTVVSDMAKNLRRGKVFIDWSQNSDFKTTIGVYSLRAKADVPHVSAPVTWSELEEMILAADSGRLRFSPAVLLERLEKSGDHFAPLLKLKQRLPAKVADDLPRRERQKSTKSAGRPATKIPAKPDHTDLESLPKTAARFIEPMLLLRTNELPDSPDWMYEIKLDGYRALGIKRRGQVQLRSRNDNDFNARYPLIREALSALPDETTVDGEIVALDDEGRPSFNRLQNYGSSKTPILYYIFDVVVLEGRDVSGEPLHARRAMLERRVLTHLDEPIRYSPALDASLPDLIRSVRAQGLEGLVAKRLDSRYEIGTRSGAWQKMRINQGQEFVIGGYTVGGRGFDALIFGYYDETGLRYVARTRNGFTPRLRQDLLARFDGLATGKCPFVNLPEARNGRWGEGLTAAKMNECRWLKPELVGQFEFTEWTPENHLRHSRFVGLRDDKRPLEVTRET